MLGDCVCGPGMNASYPPAMPPLAPATELPGVGSFIIGCIISLASGFFTALSMNVNRWALAHAEPQRVRFVPCIVQPWMMWIWAMFLYNVGATALASVAQLFIPLSLFAPIFITLLVFNLIIARWWLKEEITGPKVAGALCIIVGAVLTGAGTPLTSVPLQVEYPCVGGRNCVYHKMRELAVTSESIGWQAFLGISTLLSVIAILFMEFYYPTLALLKKEDPSSAPTNSSPDGPEKTEGGADPAESAIKYQKVTCCGIPVTPRLAPRWLERLMAFVYPCSFGLDEGIAHLWLRGDTAMSTQCMLGGCANETFIIAVLVRWGFSIATTFWLIVVFRRYETTIALPIEYGTVTAVDVISGLIFYQEYVIMSGWQLALVIIGCVFCCIGVGIGLLECRKADQARTPDVSLRVSSVGSDATSVRTSQTSSETPITTGATRHEV